MTSCLRIIMLSYFWIIILENVVEDWPYTIKKQLYSEQSPVDISTKNARMRFLPFVRYFGYWAFNRATVDIANNGHTGIRIWMIFYLLTLICYTTKFALIVRVKLANNSDEVPFITGGPLFDSKYEFEQMHFHWGKNDLGSEHKVNGHQ